MLCYFEVSSGLLQTFYFRHHQCKLQKGINAITWSLVLFYTNHKKTKSSKYAENDVIEKNDKKR